MSCSDNTVSDVTVHFIVTWKEIRMRFRSFENSPLTAILAGKKSTKGVERAAFFLDFEEIMLWYSWDRRAQSQSRTSLAMIDNSGKFGCEVA